jgi:hypothetical protein
VFSLIWLRLWLILLFSFSFIDFDDFMLSSSLTMDILLSDFLVFYSLSERFGVSIWS